MNLLVHEKELLKNTMKYGIRLVIHYKKNLIVCQYKIINSGELRFYNNRINTNFHAKRIPEDH